MQNEISKTQQPLLNFYPEKIRVKVIWNEMEDGWTFTWSVMERN
jgi:hypothetical protein